jgi:RimJ/RimL family protein N-acetyltransferase
MSGLAGAKPPERVTLEGRYTRLEAADGHHAAGLYAAMSVPDAALRFAYLPVDPPRSADEVRGWISEKQAVADPIIFVVIDGTSGLIGGRQSLMRIVPEHGVIEIGHVYWGPSISRTRVATEALYLFARYVFDDLGYRRFEWKCNNRNEASKSAAARFGFTFEGIFRQHMIVKNESRDTAWYAMLDSDWPRLRAGYERWLDPANFDGAGMQKTKLRF